MAKDQTTATDYKGPAMCKCCLWAHLIQYDQNPVLAECLRKPQPYNTCFPYTVEVAGCTRNCTIFKFDPSEKEIEHRSHHRLKKGKAA